MSGWGLGAWGSSPWGSGADAPTLASAEAIRENLVRLTFSTAIKFDLTGGPRDGARPSAYSVTPVAGTVGLDGEAARAVLVGRVDAAGAGGAAVDLWLDRPLTHYPALYVASASGVYGATGVPVEAPASAVLYGVRAHAPSKADPMLQVVGRDLANPQTGSDLVVARAAAGVALGGFPVDVTGDYAFDGGTASYVKRCVRRLLADPGAYAHLGPEYGAGLRRRVKRLASRADRADLERVAAEQVRREPETADASAALALVASNTWELRVRARTRFSDRELSFGVPLLG